jgi:outer membrane receptor protein involved in Fe transport
MQHASDDGVLEVNAYAIRSRLDLFSDFTFFLDHPIDGDPFEQAEARKFFGGAVSRSWNARLAGYDTTNTIGAQLRHDRLDPVGLYSDVARVRAATTQESRVRETSVALYAENATQWTPWLRSVAGLRTDRFDFDVTSSIPQNSGKTGANITSPKLSLIFGPWHKTEYFLNYGWGFHSNDARGTTETLTPKERLPAEPVTPLVRSKGAEVGLRTEIVPGLQSSLGVWQLKLGSELVFSGDAGDTSPSRASKRSGIEWNNHIATRWLLLDLDVAASRARFAEDDPAGNFIPGSVDKVASFGATVTGLGLVRSVPVALLRTSPLDRGRQRALEGDDPGLSARRLPHHAERESDARRVQPVRPQGERHRLLRRSRLRGEPPQGVNDIHFHPVEPRSARLTVSLGF